VIRLPERCALYFGYREHGGGHWLSTTRGQTVYDPAKVILGFPWTDELMDTGLLKNGKHPDVYDGKVFWTCGGRDALWLAFFWWDRSGDRRQNSNSGFYVRGFRIEERQEAFDFACKTFLEVVHRQKLYLILQS
jgi:hypothetical protein